MKTRRIITTLLAVGLFMGLTGVAQAGLTAYWSFDTGTPLVDSANGISGTLTGSAAITGGGYTGNGLDVSANDNDWLSVSSATMTPYAPGTNDFSISMWIKPQAGAGLSGFLNTTGTQGVEFHTTGDPVAGGKLALQLIFGSDSGFSAPRTTTIGIAADNTWYHIAVSVDRTNAKLSWYVNGVAETVMTSVGSFLDASGNIAAGFGNVKYDAELQIGGNNNGGAFQGMVDDFAIYDIALSAGEVAGLADGSLTPDNLIPEPATMSLLALGGIGVLARRRRR
ncbi:MAG: PEP-CTERM sorting domain-containing protein [bacterium]|nr:PEP-CTERM sorting domain-containing protein [bacterium]